MTDPGAGLADPGRLDCIELVELVTDYLEAALSPEEQERFEHHLAGCVGCTAYLEQMGATIAAAGRIGPEPVPAEVVARLVQAYRDSLDC
jgi:anti-sigma factor RsiW